MTKKKPTKPRRPLTRWFEVQVREVFRHSLLVQATTQAEARRLVQDGYGHHEMNPLNDAELWTRSESRIGKPPLPGSVVSAKVYDYGPETDPGRTWVLRQQVMATCSECGEEHPAYDLDEIENLRERVAPNDPMPAGECPDCDGLAYLPPRDVDLSE